MSRLHFYHADGSHPQVQRRLVDNAQKHTGFGVVDENAINLENARIMFEDDIDSDDNNGSVRTFSACAINSQYAALCERSVIRVQRIASEQQSTSTIPFNVESRMRKATLAFSPNRVNLLATANGAQVLVYDVETGKVATTIKGSGRVVTALSWHGSEDDLIATGTTDGSICIWSLKSPLRPLHQIRGGKGACTNIAFRPVKSGHLAARHSTTISIWSLSTVSLQSVLSVPCHEVCLFTWLENDNAMVSTLSSSGTLHLSRLRKGHAESKTRSPNPVEYNSFGDAASDANADMRSMVATTTHIELVVRQACMLGGSGLVILPHDSTTLHFYAYDAEAGNATELWRLQVRVKVDCFIVRAQGNGMETVVCSRGKTFSWAVPLSVLDGMNWSSTHTQSAGKSSEQLVNDSSALQSSMRPESARRIEHIARQPRGKASRAEAALSGPKALRNALRKHADHKRSPEGDLHDLGSVHSGLELPDTKPVQNGSSPIPYLSPAIPARRLSVGSTMSLDKEIKLQPESLLETSSLAATEGHESDSDDETFAEHMQDSTSFLPGGLNVPLPRTCGARFAANGQLLTFFPVRLQPATFAADLAFTSEYPTDSSQPRRASSRFPGFGNLQLASRVDSASHVYDRNHPSDSMADFSFDSHPSWTARTSPVKQSSALLGSHQRVKVSARDTENLTPTRKALALEYQLVVGPDDVATSQCRNNAKAAMRQGLGDAAEAWDSLAMLLEGQPSARVQADPAVAPLHPPGPDSAPHSEVYLDADTHASYAESVAFQWMLENLFVAAERRADVQLLACMSTVLVEAMQQKANQTPVLLEAPMSNHLADRRSISNGSIGISPVLPMRKAMGGQGDLEEPSPVRFNASGDSSRGPSQPTTPYLDSSSSTPPLASSAAFKQGIGLTASGSVSPERYRSSFSLAAKNYAASIAEKFNYYGSSPPTRKTGTSPGNELSSSLPTASGSWGKSVSFASTNGPRSLSLAQEDDEYDSDRTIEDSSLPATPKSPIAPVVWKFKNESLSDDAACRSTGTSLPAVLLQQFHIWRECYADHLRSWGLLHEAAELMQEPESGFGRAPDASSGKDSIIPVSQATKRPTCGVCYCLIQYSMHLCLSCLHTTHPACLEAIASPSWPALFKCPTGCGCECASIVDVSYSLEHLPFNVEETPAALKKKPSLTDPLRLWQRLQGESW